jgi:signal transduction histidine kinase
MRERVRQFGGAIKIESNGTGTKISVTLPVSEPDEKSSNASSILTFNP